MGIPGGDSASVLDRLVRQGLLAKVRSDRGLGAPYVYSVTAKALWAAGSRKASSWVRVIRSKYPGVEAMRGVITSRLTPTELAAIRQRVRRGHAEADAADAERPVPRGQRRVRVAGPADSRGRAMTGGGAARRLLAAGQPTRPPRTDPATPSPITGHAGCFGPGPKAPAQYRPTGPGGAGRDSGCIPALRAAGLSSPLGAALARRATLQRGAR